MSFNFKNRIKLISIILISVFCVSCGNSKINYDTKRITSNIYTANENIFADGTAKNIVVPTLLEDQLVNNVGAESYFIASTNRFSSSFAKYHTPYKKMPMASLTKMMTALVVLKNVDDLSKEYYVSSDAVDLEKDESKANLKSGDRLSVRDLLYGLMIPSGNDAAMCLAENVFDSLDNFVIAMNNEAERLGAINTHFDNPVGLDSDYHFTTAYDMFLISRELMKYPIIKDISTKKEYTAEIVQSDGTKRNETWLSTNYFVTEELLMSNNVELFGTKTGNTKKAGSCLVVITKDKKTDDEYISVVLNAKSKRNSYYNTNALLSSINR